MTARQLRPDKTISWVVEAKAVFDMEAAQACVSTVGEPLVGPFAFLPEIAEAFPDVEQRRLASLARALNETASTFRWEAHLSTLASHSQVVDQCRTIAATGEQFLRAFGLNVGDDPGCLYPRLGSGGLWAFAALSNPDLEGKPRVDASLRGVMDLVTWARQLEAREAPKVVKKERADRRQADEAFRTLLQLLAGVFFQYWGKEPGRGFSRTTTKPDSPFIRFLLFTVAPITGRARSAEALNTAWRRCQIKFQLT